MRQNRSGTFGPAHSELVPPTNPGGTPSIFICPITREAFEDPVVAADGYTYERSAIVQWLRNNSKSPMTNMELDHKSLTPNISVRSGIDEWRQWRGLAKEGLRGGRHLQTPSIGGSSQGSFSNLMPPPAMHAGGFQGAVILANPVAMGSACSARSDSSSDPLRALGERL